MMFFNLKLVPPVIAMLLVLFDKDGSSVTAPRNTTGHPHPTSLKLLQDRRHDPKGGRLMEQSISSSVNRNLQTCTSPGFTFNACANCCGYKFANDLQVLESAVSGYPNNQGTYGEMNCWDVSDITDMHGLFDSKDSFDEPIGCWDVSKVTDMKYMFKGATKFNQTIGNWDVSKVTDMSIMFSYATSFNQPLGNWDVSIVYDMFGMFWGATNFNQAIGNWNISKVTEMSHMFFEATNLNQDLCAWYNHMQNTTNVYNMLFRSGCTHPDDPNLSTKSFFCQTCNCSEGKSYAEMS
jgi:surface protein